MSVFSGFSKKLRRIQAGGPIRSMELFAGCGGISLGFLTAGFSPIASVEIEPHAALSHDMNFGAKSSLGDYPGHHVARDVTKEDPESIFKELSVHGPVQSGHPGIAEIEIAGIGQALYFLANNACPQTQLAQIDVTSENQGLRRLEWVRDLAL